METGRGKSPSEGRSTRLPERRANPNENGGFVKNLQRTLVCSCPAFEEADLQRWLKERWKTSIPWRIRRIYGGNFLVFFPNNQWRMVTLERGRQDGMDWKEWNRRVGTWPAPEGRKEWVELLGLPLDLWNEKIISQVVREFGTLIEIHSDTRSGRNLEAARIRVKVQENVKLPTRVKLSLRKEEFWIGIHESRKRKLTQSWVEVVREKQADAIREEQSVPPVTQMSTMWQDMHPPVEVESCQGRWEVREIDKQQGSGNGRKSREEGEGEVEDSGDSPDPFGIWQLLGGKKGQHERLWREMGELVAEEFQGLSLGASRRRDGSKRSPIRQETSKGQKTAEDTGEDRAMEVAASESFLLQLRDTEEVDKRGEEEIYSPSNPGDLWGEDSWSRETVMVRGRQLGLNVGISEENMLRSWTQRMGEGGVEREGEETLSK